MKFTDFYVTNIIYNGSTKPIRLIIYTDDVKETVEKEYANDTVTIIDVKDYTVDDYVNIVEALLEDVNAHKYCNIVSDIIKSMRNVFISENSILDFMKVYTEHMFALYGS